MEDILDVKIEATRRSFTALRRGVGKPDIRTGALSRALDDLSTTLEELEVTAEELRQRNDELIVARQEADGERRRYTDLFDSAPEAYLVTDLVGAIHEANALAGAMLGVHEDRLKGKPLIVYVAREERPAFGIKMAAAAEGMRLTWETGVAPRGGDLLPVEVTASPSHDGEGRIAGLRWLIRDITDRRVADEAMANLLQVQSDQATRLERFGVEKNAMLAGMSHDVQGPLVAMHRFLELLAADPDAALPERKSLVAGAIRSLARVKTLIGDALELSHGEEGSLTLQRNPTNLRDLARRVAGENDNEGHAVRVLGDASLVPVDAARVERIVGNLLANALLYAPPASPIAVNVRRVQGGVQIEVDDVGPGVPQVLKEAIFEPFRRGDSLEHPTGSGLGLALVSRFAAMHGGRAWVEDRTGGGSSFRVFLPDVPTRS